MRGKGLHSMTPASPAVSRINTFYSPPRQVAEEDKRPRRARPQDIHNHRGPPALRLNVPPTSHPGAQSRLRLAGPGRQGAALPGSCALSASEWVPGLVGARFVKQPSHLLLPHPQPQCSTCHPGEGLGTGPAVPMVTVSVWGDENAWEPDSGDGCKTV